MAPDEDILGPFVIHVWGRPTAVPVSCRVAVWLKLGDRGFDLECRHHRWPTRRELGIPPAAGPGEFGGDGDGI